MTSEHVAAVVLAAGKSSRMGQAKMALPWGRTTKRGMREADARPLLAHVEGQGPDAVRLTLDWSQDYASPLALVRLVNPDLAPAAFLLTKLAQIFAA